MSKKGVLWGVAIVLLAGLVLSSIPAGWRKNSTCVICRGLRRDASQLGFRWTTYRETACSRWYAANVEPAHTHIWERGTCTSMVNVLGLPFGFGCSPGRFPIWLLSPDTQLAVYQHFDDPLEAKALFANLTDARTRDDRLDEHDESKGHLMVRAIADWQTAGFPGNWQDWWTKWWEKHVADHGEWLERFNADSDVNFREWPEQRATVATDAA